MFTNLVLYISKLMNFIKYGLSSSYLKCIMTMKLVTYLSHEADDEAD